MKLLIDKLNLLFEHLEKNFLISFVNFKYEMKGILQE